MSVGDITAPYAPPRVAGAETSAMTLASCVTKDLCVFVSEVFSSSPREWHAPTGDGAVLLPKLGAKMTGAPPSTLHTAGVILVRISDFTPLAHEIVSEETRVATAAKDGARYLTIGSRSIIVSMKNEQQLVAPILKPQDPHRKLAPADLQLMAIQAGAVRAKQRPFAVM